MKKLLFLTAIALIGCNKKSDIESKTQTKVNFDNEAEAARITDSAANAVDYQASSEVYGENPKVIEAKKLIDESSLIMEKGIRKEMTVKESNSKINPLMEKFQKINSTLSPTEQEYLKNYRITRAQKSIDLQIKNSN